MKIMISVPRLSSSLEPELLLRFVMRQLSEIVEPDSTEPPPVSLALTLAAVSHNKKFHDCLKEQVTSSSGKTDEILGMYKDLFMPALGQIENRHAPDDPNMGEENPFPDEQNCKRVLRYALGEGKRILAGRDFLFLKIFEFLTRTGLSCYSFRLLQFEDVCHTFRNDPENIVRQGIEIIEAITFSPQNKN